MVAVVGGKPLQNGWVASGVSVTAKFLNMNYFDSQVYFRSSLRLLDPEALGNSLGGPANQTRGDGWWHTATGAAAMLDVENSSARFFVDVLDCLSHEEFLPTCVANNHSARSFQYFLALRAVGPIGVGVKQDGIVMCLHFLDFGDLTR